MVISHNSVEKDRVKPQIVKGALVMKKQNLRSFLAGALVTLLCVALIGTAAATMEQRTLTANYSDIKITLDGTPLSPKDANGVPVEPFTVNGTTYLPVRAIGEALGLGVDWDGSTSTVILTSPVRSGVVAASLAPVASQPSEEDAVEYERALRALCYHNAVDQHSKRSSLSGYSEYLNPDAPVESGPDAHAVISTDLAVFEDAVVTLRAERQHGSSFVRCDVIFDENNAFRPIFKLSAYLSSASATPSFEASGSIDAPAFSPSSRCSFSSHSGSPDLVADYEVLATDMVLSSLEFLNYYATTNPQTGWSFPLDSLGFDLGVLGL